MMIANLLSPHKLIGLTSGGWVERRSPVVELEEFSNVNIEGL
jgi:hypothetical protein